MEEDDEGLSSLVLLLPPGLGFLLPVLQELAAALVVDCCCSLTDDDELEFMATAADESIDCGRVDALYRRLSDDQHADARRQQGGKPQRHS